MIYALVAVLIISLITLGIGRLVASHAGVEETARGYSRAIYIAEAAANWEINKMSRGDHVDQITSPYEVDYNPLNPQSIVPVSVLGKTVLGGCKVWVSNTDLTSDWNPPGNFIVTAIGTDPDTNISRQVTGYGQATGLSEPFVLFGVNALTFNSSSNNVCTLSSGYIGSNGTVSSPGNAAPTTGNLFGGCRLGAGGVIQTGDWTQNWDMPVMPDPFFWPTVDTVRAYIEAADQQAGLDANLDPDQVQYRSKTDGSYHSFLDASGNATVPKQLTDTEFGKGDSPPPSNPQIKPQDAAREDTMRVIRLVAKPNKANLFDFNDIQMGSSDVLVLDLGQTASNQGSQNATVSIRIFVNGPVSETAVHITNLAYYAAMANGAGTPEPPSPYYLWFNKANRPLRFQPDPTVNALPTLEDHSNEAKRYQYVLMPGVRGIVYCVTGSSTTGRVIIQGNPQLNTTVNTMVAQRIRIDNKVAVVYDRNVEATNDPARYVLYYRLSSAYLEQNRNRPGISGLF
jgi:hypothetical protein